MIHHASSPRILVVEDNSDDLFFLTRALKKAGVGEVTHVAKTGAEAIAYLGNTVGTTRSTPAFPHILLLDLKVPLLDGFEVLQWIQERPALHAIKVIVCSSSPDPRDIEHAKKLGAARYLVKPVKLTELQVALQT